MQEIDLLNTDPNQWKCVNDGVMGGLSQSSLTKGDSETILYSGHVSLENNGGFASTRTYLENRVSAGYRSIRIKVLGDGKRYKLRVKSDALPDNSSYSADFTTTKEEWIEFNFDLNDFTPIHKGNTLNGYPKLDSGKITGIGFLISNEQEGAFRLEVSEIKLVP